MLFQRTNNYTSEEDASSRNSRQAVFDPNAIRFVWPQIKIKRKQKTNSQPGGEKMRQRNKEKERQRSRETERGTETQTK